MNILAIDPGSTESAYCIMNDEYKPLWSAKRDNDELLTRLPVLINGYNVEYVVIEMIASYGMKVGQEVFDTCVWIGRFQERCENRGHDFVSVKFVFRKDVKMNLCGSMRAKDSNIRQALIDRFGVVGIKSKPGWFYGFKKDIWSAGGVAVTFLDKLKESAK